MSHKLQPSTLKNDGLDSVVRENPHSSTSQISNNDGGSTCDRPAAEHTLEIASTGNSQPPAMSIDRADFGDSTKSVNHHEPGDFPYSGPASGRVGPQADVDFASAWVRRRPEPREARCEVARSAGYDPTGERAIACGALAQVVCEYCGPMCACCAEETFCFYGEHKLTQLPDDGPIPPARKRRGRISEVVYVELKCPNCKRVRLALPKNHRPQRVRKCPTCKTKSPAEYLAHGFTRRRLPYHEVFTAAKELPEGVEFKRRMPWDRRPNWWVEE